MPPHNYDLEQTILGCVLLEGLAAYERIADRVSLLDFYPEKHRVVWAAMQGLWARGQGIDLGLVQEALVQTGELAMAGGPAALALLVEKGCVVAYLEDHLSVVLRDSGKRQAIAVLTTALDQAHHTSTPATLATEIGEQLAKIAERTEPEAAKESTQRIPPFVTLHKVLEATALDMRMSLPDLVPSPIEALNKRFGGGFKRGEFVILGGASGTSKSALMGWWSRYAASQGHQTGVVSVEMTNADLGQRILADAAQVSATSLRSQDLNEFDWERIDRIIPTFEGLPVYFCDEAVHVLQVGRMLKRADPPMRLVFVDYMQLIDAPRAAARYQEVGLVAKLLKRYAKKYQCTIVGISSTTPPPPTGKKQTQQAPSMRNLRESRDLEYHADVILMLWQPDREKSQRELIIDKGRNGAAEGYRVRLEFTPMYLRFQEA